MKGLLDAKSDEEFENEFARLEKRWQERGAVGVQFRRYAVILWFALRELLDLSCIDCIAPSF